MEVLERKAAITGIGQSAVGRNLGRTGLDLTIDAALEAINDAGLSVKDIDGATYWPPVSAAMSPGMSPVSIAELKESLNLNFNWFCGAGEGAGQFSSIILAAMAVATGQARHVLCFRTLTETTSQTRERRASVVAPTGGGRAVGNIAFLNVFHSYSAAQWCGLFAQRHFHEFGTTREQMAQIALNGRKNAMLNPKGIFRTPLTMDDYLNARMISTPLCLFDCDIPCDGATVVIVSSVDAARDCRKTPIRIQAAGGALHGRDSWDQFDDLTTMAARDAAKMMWDRTDLKPKDVDVMELYDGFSILCMIWIEAMGFCGKGEVGPFIEGGTRIALDGELPLNTNGGQLSAGRMHGYGFLHEACVQLRHEGGERQVKRKRTEVAVAGAGGGPLGGCLLLTRGL